LTKVDKYIISFDQHIIFNDEWMDLLQSNGPLNALRQNYNIDFKHFIIGQNFGYVRQNPAQFDQLILFDC